MVSQALGRQGFLGLPYAFVAAAAVGMLLGVVATWQSPLLVIGMMAVLFYIIAALKRPEILLLAYLFLTSSVIRVTKDLSISIGIGTLYVTDLLLLFSFSLIVVRLLVERDFKIVRTPLDLPLSIFLAASLFSTFIAIIGGSLPFLSSLGEVRTVISYSLFFVVTNLVRERRQVTLVTEGLIFLAFAVALATITQSLVGYSQVILAGRVEAGRVEGSGQILYDVTRVIPPGQSVMMVAFIAGCTILTLTGFRLIHIPRFFQLFIICLGIVVTFFRASWIAIGLVILLLGFLTRGLDRRRLVSWALVAIMAVTLILIAVIEQPDSRPADLARATFDRIATLADASTYEDPGSSLRWRDFEYTYALPHILSNPFVGIGLGAMYRPLTSKDGTTDLRTFIHNGHISVMVKSGIFGYVGLLWFMLAALVRGLEAWRHIPDPYMRSIVLAFALTMVGILIVSVVEPYMIESAWAPVIGIIAGINEVILSWKRDDSPRFLETFSG